MSLVARILARHISSLSGEDQKAVDKLNRLKGLGTYKEQVPIPFGKTPVKTDLYASMRKDWPGSPKTLAFSDLTPTQTTVLRYHVEAIIKAHPKGLPLVVKKKGLNLILDGHHRLTADWLRGHKNAEVKFVDLDLRAKRSV